jgi:methyl-accepting chemotaxis protein
MQSKASQTQLDDFAFGERIINYIRWPLILILLLFNNVGFTENRALILPINVMVLLALAMTGFIQYRLHQGRSFGQTITLTLAVIQDTLITVGVSLTGLFDSHFFIFYYPSLLGFSLAFPLRTNLIYVTVLGLVYSALCWFLTPGLSGDVIAIKVLIERCMVMYLIAVIGWFVVREERQRRNQALAAERQTAEENEQLYLTVRTQMDNWQRIGEANDHTARQLAALAHSLAALAQQMEIGSAEITAAAQEITKRAVTNLDQVATIGHVTNRVVAAAHDLTDTAEPTGAASAQAQHAVDRATEAVQALSRRSAAIGHLVDAVRRVADQTNLLAFNANIEAIQAGERGQRFAIVANEVRLVAERAIGLAREIDQLGEEIQIGTGQVLEAMTEIAELVNRTGELVQVTSQTSQSQQSSAELLAGSVATLKEVSQQNAADLQAVTTTVQQQRVALKQVADLSQELADSAGKLSSLTATVAA